MRLSMPAEIEIDGDPADPYFNAAEHHAAAMAPLVAHVRALPDDAVIFDVGANIGLATIAIALAKPNARIFSFEPSPGTFAYLERNVRRFAQVTPIQAAASDAPGMLTFHATGYTAGAHVVGRGGLDAAVETIDVEAIRLDDFAETAGILPDFIKLDIEGHEPEALAGASRILKARRPLVFMEFNAFTLNALAGHSPSAFATALWDRFDVAGYDTALALVHDNMVARGCVTDILIRLKDGMDVPSLREMSFPPAARAALRQAESAVP